MLELDALALLALFAEAERDELALSVAAPPAPPDWPPVPCSSP
jgi:hypothetical protein